jgi:hypothetical protein
MAQSKLGEVVSCTAEEDNCCICLEPCKKRQSKRNVGCENQHFVHFQCFARMACASTEAGGLKLKCPLCRGAFQCANCGVMLRRFICLNCVVIKTLNYPTPNISYDLRALFANPNPNPARPVVARFGREELIVSQHLTWALFSVLVLSWISKLFPMTMKDGRCVWRQVATYNTIVNWLVASDRIVVEILGKFSEDRNDYFFQILVGSFKCVHWCVRILWFAVMLMALFS